jgi:heat shock protein HslJ
LLGRGSTIDLASAIWQAISDRRLLNTSKEVIALNKKTFAWILVVIFLVLLGITLLALLGARRSSGTEGTAPTKVPTAIAMPTATSIPLAPTATSKPAPTAVPTTPPSNDAAIQNIVWQWTQLTDQDTVTAVPNPANYTLVFRSDGTFTGTADCNQISGTYSTGNGFSINVKTSTNAYCGESSMDQVYLKTLNDVVAGGPDGAGGLALETAGGAQRMQFRNGGTAP